MDSIPWIESGERELLKAILLNAISYLFSEVDPNWRSLRQASTRWMNGKDDHVFSFVNVCDALNIDASRLRADLEKKYGIKFKNRKYARTSKIMLSDKPKRFRRSTK